MPNIVWLQKICDVANSWGVSWDNSEKMEERDIEWYEEKRQEEEMRVCTYDRMRGL